MKTRVLRVLKEAGGFVSGGALCKSLGVTRAAVWKVIESLRSDGYEIEAVTGRGYRLTCAPDILSVSELKSAVDSKWLGKNIIYLPETDSTNTQLKLLAEQGAEHGTVMVADMQVAGRGRRGRSWVQSPGENISMSFLLRPDIDTDRASMLTLVAAMAVSGAIGRLCSIDYGEKTGIKWPNDIVLHGKKVCGILTEMSAERDFIHYVVVGIGINVKGRDIPEDLKDTASSILLQTGCEIGRSRLIGEIIREFEGLYEKFLLTADLSHLAEEYNDRLIGRGGTVRVLDPLGEYEGESLGITPFGELRVGFADGAEREVSSGEVSVRGLYGYV